jgi:hypothetical protein
LIIVQYLLPFRKEREHRRVSKGIRLNIVFDHCLLISPF